MSRHAVNPLRAASAFVLAVGSIFGFVTVLFGYDSVQAVIVDEKIFAADVLLFAIGMLVAFLLVLVSLTLATLAPLYDELHERSGAVASTRQSTLEAKS